MDRLDCRTTIDVAEVEAKLAELWRQAASRDRSVVRTCMLNLIVVCADAADGRRVGKLLSCISRTAPSRALVIAPREPRGAQPGAASLQARVSAHWDGESAGGRICSEQITLEVHGDGSHLVPPTVLQLLVQELPVTTWWRRGVLRGDPLLAALSGLSQRLIIDSSSFRNPAVALHELCDVSGAGHSGAWHAADLTWARQDPWREAIATLFDLEQLRPRLGLLSEVAIQGGGPALTTKLTAAGAYLASWLVSRLGWQPGDRPDSWRRADSGAVRIQFQHDEARAAGELGRVDLVCAGRDGRQQLTAERDKDGALLRLSVQGAPLPGLPRLLRLPERDEGALLCGMLQRPAQDPIYEAALACAARMADA